MPALDCSALVDGRIRTSSVHDLDQRYSEVMFVYSNIYFNSVFVCHNSYHFIKASGNRKKESDRGAGGGLTFSDSQLFVLYKVQ